MDGVSTAGGYSSVAMMTQLQEASVGTVALLTTTVLLTATLLYKKLVSEKPIEVSKDLKERVQLVI